ncbi:hypothetical protein FA95DRAFT_1555170 [Auriscalpium vulgare]|uniref:Uncharacterized protein n=1 Tax=Auriscalpium vulgare TaxID=40419 RepID=A0ACB8S4C6_9AGAM|nr:hypothetical protein FA95DRAFT_1555170 [Auriscalpium vulgare]
MRLNIPCARTTNPALRSLHTSLLRSCLVPTWMYSRAFCVGETPDSIEPRTPAFFRARLGSTRYKGRTRWAHSPGLSANPLHQKFPPAISAMNAFANGTRVTFFNASGQLTAGTVKSTNIQSDGTQIVVIQVPGGTTVSLPRDVVNAA